MPRDQLIERVYDGDAEVDSNSVEIIITRLRRKILRHGLRLDESVPGNGFGLSITLELAELYGGALSLEPSGLGGLRAHLRLPA